MIKVHLIGTGRWSSKIAKILESSVEPKYEPAVLSITDLKTVDLNEFRDSIIWLTLFPQSQIEQINVLKQINVKVILEKPYYLSMEQRDDFLKAIRGFEESFWPSIPWQYGAPWRKYERTIKSSKKRIEIDILHMGNPIHHSIPFFLDWCSHDVHMLIDFFMKRNKIFPEITQVSRHAESLAIILADDSKVTLSCKESDAPKYTWKILDENGTREINFLDFGGRDHSISRHPIESMLDDVLDGNRGLTAEKLNFIDYLLCTLVQSERRKCGS